MRSPIPIVRHTLDNGLEVVLSRDDALPLVAVNLWYHVGSKNERPGKTGFAHLFEHMLFQGSEHVETNGHFAHLQQVGGVANGSTSRDRTNYYETLPASHLELALWLESDRMGFLLPAMTPEKLENQRQVVMNERRQRVDNQPYGRAGERFFELLYPAPHPYHWPVIGYLEDIAAATLDDVAAFFRTYYRPANAVLTLVGDLDEDAALAAVERYFGPLPGGDAPPPVVAAAPAPDGEQREELSDAVQLPRVYIGYPIPPYGDPGWYTAELLAAVLADGKSSPLYQDLVYDRQLAQGVTAYVYDTELTSTLLLIATGRPETRPEELEQGLSSHLAALAQAPPEAGDLERARNRQLTRYHESLQRFDQRADLLAQMTTYFDRPERLDEEAERYLAPSAAEISALAATCEPRRRVVVTVVPQ